MSVRKFEYILSASGISPQIVQQGGVQFEHNATQAVFIIPNALYELIAGIGENKTVIYRVDAIDGEGGYHPSESIKPIVSENDANQYHLIYPIPYDVSSIGGTCQLTVVATRIDENNTEEMIYCSDTARIEFSHISRTSLQHDKFKTELGGILNQAKGYMIEAAEVDDEGKLYVKYVNGKTVYVGVSNLLSTQTITAAVNATNNAINATNIANKAAENAQNAASGVMTIEQYRQNPMRIYVMPEEKYQEVKSDLPTDSTNLVLIEDDNSYNELVNAINANANNIATIKQGTVLWEGSMIVGQENEEVATLSVPNISKYRMIEITREGDFGTYLDAPNKLVFSLARDYNGYLTYRYGYFYDNYQTGFCFDMFGFKVIKETDTISFPTWWHKYKKWNDSTGTFNSTTESQMDVITKIVGII